MNLSDIRRYGSDDRQVESNVYHFIANERKFRQVTRRATSPEGGKVVTIPKEKAVFWMDGQGGWHNCHGPFEHKKLIAHFNASIRKDADGYFVTQTNGQITEKVYFHCETTALFAVDIKWLPVPEVLLNTEETSPLDPESLFLRDDQLFLEGEGDVIKFAQGALMKISERMEFDAHGACWLQIGNRRCRVRAR